MDPDAYCHRCGAPLDALARFCKKCGTRRIQERETSSSVQPPPPAARSDPHLAGAIPTGQPHRQRRVWVAVTAATGALLVLAVVIVLLRSSSGASRNLAPPVVTLTTAASSPSGATTSPAPAHPSTAPAQTSTRTSPPSDATGARLIPSGGAHMRASTPVGWSLQEREVQKQGYIESKWTSPADAEEYLLIDESPATHLTPEQDAKPVHASTEQTSGYHEIYYGPGDLVGIDSWMWVFQLPNVERVDYFFESCTNAFGVLGSTSTSNFARLKPTFRASAQSVESSCH